MTDEEIIQCIGTQSSLRRGFRFDEKTSLLVLRLPEGSPYQNEASLVDLRNGLVANGLDSKLYQIDEDWYLYIFLAGFIDSDEGAQGLRNWCYAHSFEIGAGSLEIHPCDQSIPFPLQPSFCWLNSSGQVIVRRSEIATEAAVALFLADSEKHEVSPHIIWALCQLPSPPGTDCGTDLSSGDWLADLEQGAVESAVSVVCDEQVSGAPEIWNETSEFDAVSLNERSAEPAVSQQSLLRVDDAAQPKDNLPGQLFLFPLREISFDSRRDNNRSGSRRRPRPSPGRSPS